MNRRNFFSLFFASPENMQDELIQSTLAKDPFFEQTKKIITKKEYIPLLEELLIDTVLEYEKAQKSELAPPMNSASLKEEFQDLSRRVNAFLEIEPKEKCEVIVLSDEEKEALKKKYHRLYPTALALGTIAVACIPSFLFLERRRFLQLTIPLLAGLTVGATTKITLKRFANFDELSDIYSDLVDTAFITESNTEVQLGSLTHEYVHFLQDQADMLPLGVFSKLEAIVEERISIMKEGHARGVAYHIMKKRVEETKNPAYLFKISGLHLLELYHAYNWSCKINGVEAKESKAAAALVAKNKLNEYCLGTTLFMIAERKLGKDIYRKALNNDFSFLDELEKERIV